MRGDDYRMTVELDFDESYYDASKDFEKISYDRSTKFEEAVFKTISTIERNPFSWQIRYKDIRAAIVPNFAFLILYRVDEKNQETQILDLVGQSTDWLPG